MTKGGKRIGAGRPRIHRKLKFTLNRTIKLESSKDYDLKDWLDSKAWLCWLCVNYYQDEKRWYCKTKGCELAPDGREREIYFWNVKNCSIYHYCKVLLGKLPGCAICKFNRPTKKILYRCEYAAKCDIYPLKERHIPPPQSEGRNVIEREEAIFEPPEEPLAQIESNTNQENISPPSNNTPLPPPPPKPQVEIPSQVRTVFLNGDLREEYIMKYPNLLKIDPDLKKQYIEKYPRLSIFKNLA